VLKNAPTGVINADDNSRVVVRYCTVIDSDLHAHGQETSQYGVRHYEIYNNKFQNVNAARLNLNSWTYIRGGVVLIANNTVDTPPAGKGSFAMIVQSINRATGQLPCQTAWPAARQVGQGWSATSKTAFGNPVVTSDGVGAVLDPCYYWGNTGPGANSIRVEQYSPDDCGNGLKSADFNKSGRDYYVGTAKPGWTPYTYPHPLRTASGGLNRRPRPHR
jgi:hypothetical protein